MIISYSHIHKDACVYTTVHVLLCTKNIPLNGFEVEVLINNGAHCSIMNIVPVGALRASQFIIENLIDLDKKRSHSICCSRMPFVAGSEFLPVLEVQLLSTTPEEPTVKLGIHTRFHMHDGYGARVAVQSLNEMIQV